MYNLNNVATFILVVQTHSFTRAAKARHISRAAATKHVQQLEDELGVHLLTRSTREMILTEEGQYVYDECCRIMDNVTELEAKLSGLKNEPSGLLSVVCGPVIAHKYIIPYLPELIKTYPKINFKIDLRHVMPNMLEEKIDVVLGVFGSGPPDAIQRTLIHTQRILCASPPYLKKAKKLKKPEDLLQHALMLHPISPNESSILLKDGKKINLNPKVLINDQLTIRKCVLNDMGIGYLQRHVVEEEIRNGNLIEVLDNYIDKATIPIHLYYLQRRHLHSKIRVFVDFVIKNIEKNLAFANT